MKAAIKKTVEIIITVIVLALIICMGFLLVMAKPAKAQNKDYQFLDSTFRAMEIKKAGGQYDGKGRVFYPDRNVNLPRVLPDNKTKVYVIENITVYNSGLISESATWNDLHNYQTNLTFILRNINFYNSKTGLVIEGSHRSSFYNLSFYNCNTGARFILCLEGYAEQLQSHQTTDTGIYIGYGTCQGCTNYNSQSNNFRINGYRDYGTGTGYGLIYHGVSGGIVTSLTNEGGGRDVFLQVNARGSNFMKDFTASNFHIETPNKKCVIEALPNGSKFHFNTIYPQCGNVVIRGEGLGSIYVSGIVYNPNNPGPGGKHATNMFQNLSGSSGSLWWNFQDSEVYNRSIYDDGNWIIDSKSTKPRPYSTGQTTNNSGSNRLYEIPCFTN